MEYNQSLKPKKSKPVLCWGHKELPKQSGITTYVLGQNRIRPSLHAFDVRGPFNTIRRCRNQFLYVVPPFLGAWWLMEWAEERNRYLNSKAGRAEFADGEEG